MLSKTEKAMCRVLFVLSICMLVLSAMAIDSEFYVIAIVMFIEGAMSTYISGKTLNIID